ncbi:phosphoribosylanthranilate isomerase [Acidihalobacter ferrooxydans]|uniref:N-(5'-phosphoribosyl)anthranilate isomerase n=1 Tax=Acidihalobacter ferrooxydans TaxID=1765967 RepID=A0A1P8ULG7_9GAMM|nr:phosphoribosylanthranilate isomerase [Acidihalobacter ferrooxydans]APZ44604.1 N-(5'-phosphoribosyl)anthranilate isomerase [Acidihalobacter ferrooxydans]
MRTRVKICGIMREADLSDAVEAGADAIGLVFYARSSRNIEPQAAAALLATLPAFVMPVGLFLGADPEWVREVLRQVPLDLLQFHGRESADYCRSFGRPYMKAIGAGGVDDVRGLAEKYGDARALLLDGNEHGKPGGTGHAFDWNHIPAGLGRPLVLAGGLGPDNVCEAIRKVRPYAVDVSSGVESALGIKNTQLIQTFMNEVRRGDSE